MRCHTPPILHDYFAADSDESAAATLQRPNGPRGDGAYDLLGDWSIDPLVHRDTLDEIFTGRPYDPALDHLIADETTLRQAATRWSQSEDFFGQGDAEVLSAFLIALAALARRAEQAQRDVYCWLSV